MAIPWLRRRARSGDPKPTLRWVREVQALGALGPAPTSGLRCSPTIRGSTGSTRRARSASWGSASAGRCSRRSATPATWSPPLGPALGGRDVPRPVAAGGIATLVGVGPGARRADRPARAPVRAERRRLAPPGRARGARGARAPAPDAGRPGGLLVLLTVLAVAGLCLTQASYAGLSQRVAQRLGPAFRGRPRPAATRPGVAEPAPPPRAPGRRRAARAAAGARRRRAAEGQGRGAEAELAGDVRLRPPRPDVPAPLPDAC